MHTIEYYKEQLAAKEAMLAATTEFLMDSQRKLEEQNKLLSEIHADIFDSVRFAELIQRSLSPDLEILKIFFRDASYHVSQQMGIGGDSVFIKNLNQGIVFGLFDSTGHGIPAAMLSIGASMMVNEISSSLEIESPSTLLRLLNYRLNSTFNSGSHSIAHMEGIMFYYSSRDRVLKYSSANGKGLVISAERGVFDLPAFKRPIGGNSHLEFEDNQLEFKQGEKLLLFSDGLTDQFGGEKDKKYSKARLRALLETNVDKTVPELEDIIITSHRTWKAGGKQTDDLSFMIIEF